MSYDMYYERIDAFNAVSLYISIFGRASTQKALIYF